MPLFYLVPFSFFKDRKKPRVVDVKTSDILLYGALAVVVVLLFFGLIVVPAMMVMNQSLPTVQVQPPAF